MSWFKHSTKMRDEPLSVQIRTQLDYEAYFAYIALYELLTEYAFSGHLDMKLPLREWLEQLKMSRTSRGKLLALLDIMRSESLVNYKLTGNSLEIQSELILENTKNYTKTLRKHKPELARRIEERIIRKKVEEPISEKISRENHETDQNNSSDTLIKLSLAFGSLVNTLFPSHESLHSGRIRTLCENAIKKAPNYSSWQSICSQVKENADSYRGNYNNPNDFMDWLIDENGFLQVIQGLQKVTE